MRQTQGVVGCCRVLAEIPRGPCKLRVNLGEWAVSVHARDMRLIRPPCSTYSNINSRPSCDHFSSTDPQSHEFSPAWKQAKP